MMKNRKKKNENIEDGKIIKEKIYYDGNDIIPDEEIDDLYLENLFWFQKIKDEIKFMNENIDKSGNNYSNNNIINNKGGKIKLNSIIVK